MVQRVKEGEAPFAVPSTGQNTKTWYRVSGALTPSTIPLVLLHGGPGACSDYLWPMETLTSLYGITTINYDQIGNGRSTHLPERKGDEAFWTEALFIAELENLLMHLGVTGQYDLLGHSWGGMLGGRYAISRPKNLRKLIISNSPADMVLWVESCNILRSQLPQDVQDTLTKHEKGGTTDSDAYQAAVMVFYKRHLCRIDPFPEPVANSLNWLASDPTTYETMNGPSEFYVVGSLKNWSLVGELHKVTAETMVINAEFDEAQDSCTMPFVKEIPGAKWWRVEGASHMAHIEKGDEYYKRVGEFIKAADARGR